MRKNKATASDVISMASKYDEKKTRRFAKKIRDKAWYDDFILLFSMVKDKEFQLDKKVYLMITGALAYLVLPADAIPDFIPIVGWVDDAVVIKWVFSSAKDEIGRYRRWLLRSC